ncbi:MAG: DUF58 domain-containing protein [Candidatus Thermoplasmatota archaeon]|nr:DUF58 domain-containing protein [Candidatus Thermoplasmatota archaeon]
MIKKSGFGLLALLAYGNFEAYILGYGTFLLFVTIITAIICSDILIFNLVTANALRRVDIRRTLGKSYGRKGESISVVLKFTNATRRSIYFHYFDTLSTVFRPDQNSSGEVSLGPGETVERRYGVSSVSIGKYQVGPIIVYSEDSLRLCISSYILAKDNEIKIAPAFSDIMSSRSELLSNFVFSQGSHISKTIGQGYDFHGIRQYVDSDDFRYVAWSRFGIQTGDDLYIKEMEEERDINVIFVLDYSNAVNYGNDESRLFDQIVASVISASHAILRNRDGVGYLIVSSTHEYFIEPKRSVNVIQKFEKTVSGIIPDGSFTFQMAMERIRENVTKSAFIILLTPLSFTENFSFRREDFRISGKRPVVMLISKENYAKGLDSFQERLLRNAFIMENRKLKAISSFLNSAGIKSRVVTNRNLLPRILSEYRYGKMVN